MTNINDDNVKHHNKTINVTSGAWNKRNFSNDPNKAYDGFEIKQDHGEPTFKWLHDIKKKRKSRKKQSILRYIISYLTSNKSILR